MSRTRYVFVVVLLGLLLAARTANAIPEYCCQGVDDTSTPSSISPSGPLCSGPQSSDCNTQQQVPYENVYGGAWTASSWSWNDRFCVCVDPQGNPTTADQKGVCQGYCNKQPTPTPVEETPTPPIPTATVTPTPLPIEPVFGKTLDHLECYKIRDPQQTRGVVHLASPQFGLDKGCRIKSAKKLCVPATKAVVTAETTVDGAPWVEQSPFGTADVCAGGGNEGGLCIAPSDCPGGSCLARPLPGQHLIEDYLCYQLRCPSKGRNPVIGDQFGQRRILVQRAFELCVPARKVCHCETESVGYPTTCSPTTPSDCRIHPGSSCVCL